MQCPVCQERQWLTGSLYHASFLPEGGSPWRSQWPIAAQVCKKCGYVWLKVDQKKLNEIHKKR